MSFGCSTYLFHQERLSEAHVGAIAAHGFDAVEVFAMRSHIDYHDAATTEALRRWLSTAGLRLHAFHGPVADGYVDGRWGHALSLASADRDRRTIAVEETATVVRLAGALGCPFVVLHLGRPDDQPADGEDNRRDAVSRSLDTLDALAGECGVTLALEVIPNALSDAASLVRTIDALELEHAAICLDVGHAHIMGSVVDAIEDASGLIATTHLHDNRASQDDHLVPFAGSIDWDAVTFALRKVGYDGAWVYELASTPGQSDAVLAAARRSCERLRHLLHSDSSEVPS